ncbi:MAG TPA: sigma-54-dependent Fis family transcriptional regulator [bacterium]|nr:sigma-54-dependent Fis family transcriptional regulator [bacterium]
MPERLTILVVDDDQDFLGDFEVIGRDFFELHTADSGEKALEMLKEEEPDAVVLDLRLGSGIDGLETLKRIRETWPDLPVIMVTEHADVDTAVKAMKQGAFHYMSKHPNIKTLHAIIQKELGSVRWKNLCLEEIRKQYGEMIGRSAPMKEIYRLIARVATVPLNVLVLGESGTGKELVAREIHARSGRAGHPFVAINCAAIPPALFESEVFGHERGAFTHAVSRKTGKIEMADKGTLFLDEINSLDPDLQAKLLRVLDDKAITRVGGNEVKRVDVRVICASNQDLEKSVAEGSFREDLFHRVNGIQIVVPPLRERAEDIPELTRYFSRRIQMKTGRAGPVFSGEAIEALQTYHWPGNVRELMNVVERASVMAAGREVTVQDLKLASRSGKSQGFFQELLFLPYKEARQKLFSRFKSVYLSELIQRNQGNISKAARQAGISRPGLYRMMENTDE